MGGDGSATGTGIRPVCARWSRPQSAGMDHSWADCGMAGGKDCPWARVRMHWRYSSWIDRVGGRRMYFHQAWNSARECVPLFVGGGDSGGGGVGVACPSVFWRKERVAVRPRRASNEESSGALALLGITNQRAVRFGVKTQGLRSLAVLVG